MKTNKTKVPTTFAPETKFDVTPNPSSPFGATLETGFDRLKHKLLIERLGQLEDRHANSKIRRAANEAAALALVTCYPLLVFPALFEERIENELIAENDNENRFKPELVEA